MNKRKIAALLGVFTLLACTAAATRDKTIQPPKDSRAQRAAQEYAETIKDSKTDERKLRDEIKQAHDDASERDDGSAGRR